MNIQLDLVLSLIIVGTLLLLIMGLNRLMMESNADARLSQEVQTFANTALLIVQEELRDLQILLNVTDTTITYRSANLDTIRISREQRELMVRKFNSTTALQDTMMYSARLSDIRFNVFQIDGTGPFMLNVRITSESLTQEGVGINPPRYRAFAARDFYLRNLDLE